MTKAKKQKKHSPKPKTIYLLFDADGVMAAYYESEEEAQDDAWGPRFRPYSSIVEYVRSEKRPKRIPASG